MFKKLSSIALIAVLSLPVLTNAQPQTYLEYRKYRVSVVPGLSTNGINAPNYTARYSLNLIAGYNGGLDGGEIGLVNINKYYARGFQLGLLNASGGDLSGIQLQRW